VEERLEGLDKNIKVAIMGCAVNGRVKLRKRILALPGKR